MEDQFGSLSFILILGNGGNFVPASVGGSRASGKNGVTRRAGLRDGDVVLGQQLRDNDSLVSGRKRARLGPIIEEPEDSEDGAAGPSSPWDSDSNFPGSCWFWLT